MVRGNKYRFALNAGGHPFQIRVSNGGSAYNDGVTNNGAQSGNIEFYVQNDAPASLVYQCTAHSGMVGNIYITGHQLTNGANNRVVTATSAYGMNGEANFTYNGTQVDIAGTTDGVLNLDTTDSRGAFVRFGQGGSYHNMVGCADGLTSGDKEDLGIRATDNIIFATGGSTERLRIQSDGHLKLPNNAYIRLGDAQTSSGTLRIYSNGTQSYISPGITGNHIRFLNSGSTSQVELYFGTAQKLSTQSYGILVQGNVSATNNLSCNNNLLCSGTASVANTLTVTGSEGTDAILELLADDGDDNDDKWRIRSDATGNDLKFETYTSGSWSDGTPLELSTNGVMNLTGQLVVDKVNINDNIIQLNSGTDDLKIRGNGTGGANHLTLDDDVTIVGHLMVAHTSQRNNFFGAVSTEHAPIVQFEGTSQRKILSLTSSNTSDGGTLILARQNGNPGTNTVVANNNQIGRIDFQGNDGTNMETAAIISAEIDDTPGNDDMPGRLLFKTTPNNAKTAQERLRITSSGNVNIGGEFTQTSRTFAVAGSALFKAGEADIWLHSTGANKIWRILGSTGGSTHQFRIYDQSNAADRLTIGNTGRVRVPAVWGVNGSSMRTVQIESDGNLCAPSSIREAKINIESISDVSWLYDFNPVTFNFRTKTEVNGENVWGDEADDGGLQYGLIADEVEAVNQHLCFYDDNKLSGVHYDRMIAPLIKALQEQKAEIDALKTRVATLEGS